MAISRRTNFVSILFLTSVAVFAALILQRGFPILESDQTLGSNLSFLVLININIIAVMILGFVVIRNVIRLIIDRRRNILGARLRSRLVFAFVFLSMVPTVLLFLVAQGMIEGVLQDWFSPKIEVALDSSRNLANEFYDFVELDTIESHDKTFKAINKMSFEVIQKQPKDNNEQSGRSELDEFLKNATQDKGSLEFYVIDEGGKLLGSSNKSPNYTKDPPVSLNAASVSKVGRERSGHTVSLEYSVRGEFLKVMSQIKATTVGAEQKPLYFITLRFITPAVTNSIKSLLNAAEEYGAFKSYQRPLSSSYFLTLVVVTLLIIFAAISIAFALSRGLAVPIGLLARGTEQIANGNLNYHIPELGDDELGVLVKGFNRMTSDLRNASSELVSRSRYIEAVLSSLEVGVFSVDTTGEIRTFNEACIDILGMGSEESLIGKLYREVLPLDFVSAIEEINQRNLRGRNQVVSKNIEYFRENSQRHLTITLSRLFDESTRADVGLVILVDDVTELERAQRMAAWQEVARRIAHEIKNPLTPIQLSAERIVRIMERITGASSNIEDTKIIFEATDVIINQVQHLRQLVNEFSNFARMPKSELRRGSLNEVVVHAADAFKTSHPEINFELDLNQQIPPILIDPHQFERVLLNLLDNSITAHSSKLNDNPTIGIKTEWNGNLKLVSLDVWDNGPGVPDKDKQRIFEPYFSKKSSGTGLGLAIVKSVISDHNGFIRALTGPNGKGLVIRIEIPAS